MFQFETEGDHFSVKCIAGVSVSVNAPVASSHRERSRDRDASDLRCLPAYVLSRRMDLNTMWGRKTQDHFFHPGNHRLVPISLLMVDSREGQVETAGYERLVAQLETVSKKRVLHYFEVDPMRLEIFIVTPRQVDEGYPQLRATKEKCFEQYPDNKWLFAEVYVPANVAYAPASSTIVASSAPFPPLPASEYPTIRPLFCFKGNSSRSQSRRHTSPHCHTATANATSTFSGNSMGKVAEMERERGKSKDHAISVKNHRAAEEFLKVAEVEGVAVKTEIESESVRRKKRRGEGGVQVKLEASPTAAAIDPETEMFEKSLLDAFGDFAESMDSYRDFYDTIVNLRDGAANISSLQRPYFDPDYPVVTINSSRVSPQYQLFLNIMRNSIVQAIKKNSNKSLWLSKFDYDARHLFRGGEVGEAIAVSKNSSISSSSSRNIRDSSGSGSGGERPGTGKRQREEKQEDDEAIQRYRGSRSRNSDSVTGSRDRDWDRDRDRNIYSNNNVKKKAGVIYRKK